MLNLALRSLRHRTGAFVAGFVALFLGATMVMAFAAMLDTGAGADDPASEETLSTTGIVIGGWGLLLVLFSVSSTVALAVRQRGAEIALLKSAGATPAQIRRMIVGETIVLAVLAFVLALVPAMLVGRWLLHELIDTGQVADGVPYSFGAVAVSMGIAVTVVAGGGAAILAARPATRMRVTESLADAQVERSRLSWKSVVGACLCFAIAINLGVLTMVISVDEGYESMQTAGSAAICAAVGLALLASALIRMMTAVLNRPVRALCGVAGYLALQNLRGRSQQMARAVMPIILFSGIGIGTLAMFNVENRALAAEGLPKSHEQRDVELLNYIVIGMIVAFAAILLLNTLIAATTYRGREFGQQRLAGATPPQVLAMLAVEGAVLIITGVCAGIIASLFTIVPFNIARTDSVTPDVSPWVFLGMAATATVLTFAAGLGAALRRNRVPAIEAVAITG